MNEHAFDPARTSKESCKQDGCKLLNQHAERHLKQEAPDLEPYLVNAMIVYSLSRSCGQTRIRRLEWWKIQGTFLSLSRQTVDSALAREIVAELRNEGHVEEEVRGTIRLTPRGYRAFQNDPPPYSYRSR